MEERFAFGAPEMVEPSEEPSLSPSGKKLHTHTDVAASTAAGQISAEVDLARWAAHFPTLTGMNFSSCACDKFLCQWQGTSSLSNNSQVQARFDP